MAASLMKFTGQDVLDAMNLGGDVAGGQAGDLTDLGGVQAFQIRKDDLAIEGFQTLYEREQAVEGLAASGIGRGRVGKMFEFLEADEGMRVDAPLADDVGNGGVVGNAIDPGAEGTAGVPGRRKLRQRARWISWRRSRRWSGSAS